MANQCEWYPCHSGDYKEFSCTHCFCPEYYNEVCSGNPEYIEIYRGKIRDCSHCLVPHLPDYKGVVEMSGEAGKGDTYRPVNHERYASNYDKIDWSDEEEEEKDGLEAPILRS